MFYSFELFHVSLLFSALVATCERQSEHINRLEAGSLFHQPYLASLLAGPGIHGGPNSPVSRPIESYLASQDPALGLVQTARLAIRL